MAFTTRVVVPCVAYGIILIGMTCFAVLVSAAQVGETEVRQCVQGILERVGAGACSNYFSLESVKKADARETSIEAFVIADIDFRVKQRMGGTSQAARECTGNGWSVEVKNPYPPNTGQWFMYQSQADMDGGYLEPGRGLRVRKKFKFERWESGWRCAEAQMSPIDQAWFLNTAPPAQQPQAGRQDQQPQQGAGQGARSPAIATFDCVRSDNPRITTTLVVDFTSSSVKSLNNFGGIGAGIRAQITDATISWRNRVIKNYGGGGVLDFAGSIDRATRNFTFKGADNSTHIFECR